MNKKNKSIVLLVTSIALSSCIPIASAHAQAANDNDNAETVFVSSFGKVRYQDQIHSSVKSFDEAVQALSSDGGRIVTQGTTNIATFPDRFDGSLCIEGAGSSAKGNQLVFSQSEITLSCDTEFSNVVAVMPENGVLHSGAHTLKTCDGFDSYSKERYVENSENVVDYPAPISVGVAAGGKAQLLSGYYKSVFAENGTGNTSLELSDITADTLSLGAEVNGDLYVSLDGETKIGTLALDAGNIDGNVVVVTGGHTKIDKFSRKNTSLTGKAYVITDTQTTIPDDFFDVAISLTEGNAQAEFSENGRFLGFRLHDVNGFAVKEAVVNSEKVAPENGIFTFSENATVTPCEAIHIAPRIDGAYISGYEDGTFRPQSKITRAEAVTTLARLIADENEIKEQPTYSCFSDVSDDMWFSPYIYLFAELGYLNTIAKNEKILPNREITRGEFCELIMRVYPRFSSKVLFNVSFSDVDKEYPYRDSVEKAAFAEIVAGYEDGSFRPDAQITRAEAVTMLNRLISRVPAKTEIEDFSDIDSHWAKDQINAASNLSERDGVIMWTETKPTKFDKYMQYRYSLSNTAHMLQDEKKLNVAFIGGSVTAGAGASSPDKTSWRALTVDWFKNTYPDCDIRQVNAAIGDSYTKYAVYRMDNDLLRYDYDIVFVEYAINDSAWYSAENDNETIVYFETLIRRIYEHNPKADIVIVYTIDDKLDRSLPYFSTAAAQEKIASLYDIPSVNFGRALANYIGDNNYKWSDYFTDYVHPNDIGYTYYASVLTEYLETALREATKNGPLYDKVLPSPAAKKLWYNLTMLEANEIDLSESKNWALSDDGMYIVPTSADNELVLRTKGTDLCIAAPRADVMEYSIDGGEVLTMNMNRKPQTLGKNMNDGEHVLKIHAPDPVKLRIQRLMYNG